MEVFRLVKQKRRKARRDRGRHFADTELVVEYANIDFSALLGKINEARELLKVSKYIQNLLEVIESKVDSVDAIVCYGLGSLSESYISRHQFAALLAIKNRYNCQTSAYDPVFTPNEIEALKYFSIEVISDNDEGKRQISSSGLTLVYFAHCCSQLVNNFLWANWNCNLHNCIVLSNSFSNVIQRNCPSAVDSIACLRDVREITDEVIVENIYEVSDAFNDLSIHIFPSSKVTDIRFWADRPEPNYSGQTIEFCKKDVIITLREV